MCTTMTLNFSITVNPIIYPYVVEVGRRHDNIANPVNGSVWRGFEMLRVVMFVAATAMVAIIALLLLVIPKGSLVVGPLLMAPVLIRTMLLNLTRTVEH